MSLGCERDRFGESVRGSVPIPSEHDVISIRSLSGWFFPGCFGHKLGFTVVTAHGNVFKGFQVLVTSLKKLDT